MQHMSTFIFILFSLTFVMSHSYFYSSSYHCRIFLSFYFSLLYDHCYYISHSNSYSFIVAAHNKHLLLLSFSFTFIALHSCSYSYSRTHPHSIHRCITQIKTEAWFITNITLAIHWHRQVLLRLESNTEKHKLALLFHVNNYSLHAHYLTFLL